MATWEHQLLWTDSHHRIVRSDGPEPHNVSETLKLHLENYGRNRWELVSVAPDLLTDGHVWAFKRQAESALS